MSTAEYAARHGISESTARRWARTGRAAAVKIGRVWSFSATPNTTTPAQQLRTTLRQLSPHGNWVPMADLRDAIDMDRDRLDALLIEEMHADRLRLTEEANPSRITTEQNAAAIRVGGASCQWVMPAYIDGAGLDNRVFGLVADQDGATISEARLREALADVPEDNLRESISELLDREWIEQTSDGYRIR